MSATTTDLALLRRGREYTWGIVRRIHDVGPYSVVEAEWRSDGAIHFHAYVDAQDTHDSATCLEGALAVAMAWKHEGKNSRAPYYFLRMIGCPSTGEEA